MNRSLGFGFGRRPFRIRLRRPIVAAAGVIVRAFGWRARAVSSNRLGKSSTWQKPAGAPLTAPGGLPAIGSEKRHSEVRTLEYVCFWHKADQLYRRSDVGL